MSDNTETVVILKNVSKTFSIREKHDYSIRKRIYNLFTGTTGIRKIPALSDINLNIKKGQFIGIIGHNGSGKSTLLRVILGAIKPDKGGYVKTTGKILRLSLGVGFDPNLSARHNIYVNGSIMGLTFKEIGNKFQDILTFADLEDYVDTPIKFYSSGMYSRLAFSIAMHAKGDILLIDEFFGTVGDEAFREKSQSHFVDHILKNKTVLFVTHQLNLIEKFCQYVYVLDHGKIIDEGEPKNVLDLYRASFG